MSIPFNKPFLIGNELDYIRRAVESGQLAGNGVFTKQAEQFFEKRYGMPRALLTSSCTDALEMVALLLDIQPGDEVIAPSFAFVSTVNAFVLRGAKIVFADSCADHPNIDASKVEALITPRTKALVCVHYAGMACDMGALLALAKKYQFDIVEDAAHAIESTWNGKQLGTIGRFGTFSFHETKNVISGEGGLLSVNNAADVARAEIIRDKGTNRQAFSRGETDKYEWVDLGSSFLPSEITAAFLCAQLEQIDTIQLHRLALWELYARALQPLEKTGHIELPKIPKGASNNAHIFYVVCPSAKKRQALLSWLRKKEIHAVFHYQSLHCSPYYRDKHDGRALPNADRYSDCLLRLPLYHELDGTAQGKVVVEMVRGTSPI